MFEDEPGLPIPSYLEDDIARMHSVTNNGGSGNYKALCRINLDQILISAIYEESNREMMEAPKDQDLRTRLSHLSVSSAEIPEDPAKLQLLRKTPLSKTVIHRGEKRLLSGFADYGLFYDGSNSKALPTNFVIVEAKQQYCPDMELPELAAYMGVIHTTRKEDSKQDCVIYGMATDGNLFRFCRIDNDGIFTQSKLLEWRRKANRGEIYSNLRSIIRAAALSCPSSTPIKDPMQRKLVLSAFGSPNYSNMVDFGCSDIKFFEIDEGDEWMYDIIGKN